MALMRRSYSYHRPHPWAHLGVRPAARVHDPLDEPALDEAERAQLLAVLPRRVGLLCAAAHSFPSLRATAVLYLPQARLPPHALPKVRQQPRRAKVRDDGLFPADRDNVQHDTARLQRAKQRVERRQPRRATEVGDNLSLVHGLEEWQVVGHRPLLRARQPCRG